MLGKEVFTIKRPLKSATAFSVSWAFPNTYEIGMTSLGYQLVWWLLEQDSDLLVQRVFSNCQEKGGESAELFGFTLSWELDYINVLKMLKAAGIAPLAAERTNEDPIVFGGGPALSANPETFAEFFDVVLLGDAEVVVPALINGWKTIRNLPSRQARLEELAQIAGIYVPSLYRFNLTSALGPIESIEPISRCAPSRLAKQAFMPPPDYVAHSLILSPDTTWGDLFLVEVARSCPQECRFCLASYLTRPFRAAKVETVMQAIDRGLEHTRKIGLLGPSVTEHPQFGEIASELLKRSGTEISIASVRADSLTPEILTMLNRLGHKSVTIAIESGSERLRAVMKKNLSEDEIRHAVELVEQSGLSGMKFYGIVGLPGERQEDLDETVRLLAGLKKTHKRLRFVFGVSSFVPKAQTPFQWAGRDAAAGDKIEYLRKRLAPFGIEVRPESHNWSDIQTLLSRGDRRLTPVLLEVAEGTGKLGTWRTALKRHAQICPSQDFYVFREIPYDEVLPWSHLVDEPKNAMLLRHSETAERLASS